MKYPVLVAFLMVLCMHQALAESIPSWVKNDASWWGQGQISDTEYLKSIQWLIDNRLITQSQIQTQSDTQPPDQVLQKITGEKPQLDNEGNVWIATCKDVCFKKLSLNQDTVFSLYVDSSNSTALMDYDQFVSSSLNALSLIKTSYPHISPPTIISWKSINSNAKCLEMYQHSEVASDEIGIATTPTSIICIEGDYVFSVGSVIGTDVENVSNTIILQIPNNGE